MNQQPHPQNTKDAPRANTWKESVRRHTTGPLFSLSVHIVILAVLGSIVIAVVPKESHDDVSVEITEMEPVLPQQEEEPMPADTTVVDLPTLSLDRYDSTEQRIMDEVGVTNQEIVANIDIQSPVVIPDTMSALKLQGVLPFGRPGGGGRAGTGVAENKDDEEDDGPTLYGMLQGVFYDLKQTRGGRPTDAMGDPTKENDHTRDKMLPVLKEFIGGPWRREYDKDGQVHYPALDAYYCSPTRLWNSCFYTRQIKATEAPAAFLCGKEVKTGGWACIYSGSVVAPFSGKFRFVGFCDDILLIRFDKRIVFDYGWYSATLGTNLWFLGEDFDSYHQVLSGRPENERQRRLIADSVIYSKHQLDVYCPEFASRHGIAKGPVLEVEEGQVYPIEILISEVPGGDFTLVLFIEQLDENGEPLEPDPDSFTLFRTTLDLPPQNTREDDRRFFMPKFKPYGPVWRVVNSAEASAGTEKKNGKLPTSVLNTRMKSRPEVVNEDDEDLTL